MNLDYLLDFKYTLCTMSKKRCKDLPKPMREHWSHYSYDMMSHFIQEKKSPWGDGDNYI